MWGEGLSCRRPERDDGDWKAFKSDEGGPNHFNVNQLMWYNTSTHEYKWATLSFDELQNMLQEWSEVLHAEVANIEHTIGRSSRTSVEFPHSITPNDCIQGDELDTFVAAWHSSKQYTSALAGKALLLMRAAVAKNNPPPNEPGIWRSCRDAARSLRSMEAYAEDRRPKTPFCNPCCPKNGTHVGCAYGNKYGSLVWKKEMHASGKVKVWRCLLVDWSEPDRRLLHELARGWQG